MGSQFQQCQRIEVTKDLDRRIVTISLERFDAALGWYTAGALSIPLCQVPVLEQAIEALSISPCVQCSETACAKIIPFPLVAQEGFGENVLESAT